jgi:hypothetical protein
MMKWLLALTEAKAPHSAASVSCNFRKDMLLKIVKLERDVRSVQMKVISYDEPGAEERVKGRLRGRGKRKW